MDTRNATACEKFNTAQFHNLGFFETQILSLVGLARRKTTAQYDDRRSNSFPSAPFEDVALLTDG
jgi:hypothetical protein